MNVQVKIESKKISVKHNSKTAGGCLGVMVVVYTNTEISGLCRMVVQFGKIHFGERGHDIRDSFEQCKGNFTEGGI